MTVSLAPPVIRAGLALTTAFTLLGCGVSSVGGPLPAAGVAAPAPDMFPECGQAGGFAFSGRATLAQIGLGDMGGPDANKPGMIWVTAEPVAMQGPPGAEPLPEERLVCVEWPDGGMAGPVPPNWQPPATIDLAQPAESTPSLALLGLVVGAVVVAGVSFFAFSDRR